jgi:hypothetical protein
MRPRASAAAIAALAMALSPLALAAPAAKVNVPKSGKYTGKPGHITLFTNGKNIDLVSFSFKCHETSGATVLNDIPMKKSKKGYTFAIKAYGGVTYADEKDPDNGRIVISGRFSRTGKSAKGVLTVKTPRCGGSGTIKWHVARSSS